MHALYLLHAAWRLGLYAVYGVAALVVYRLVFALSSPLPGYVALGLVVLAVLKDVMDYLKHEHLFARLSYKFIDHNPFNIVLLWGLLTGVFTIQDPTVALVVMGLAGFDLVLDGYVDFHKEPSPAIMGIVFLVVAGALFLLHVSVGLETVSTTIWGVVQELPLDPILPADAENSA